MLLACKTQQAPLQLLLVSKNGAEKDVQLQMDTIADAIWLQLERIQTDNNVYQIELISFILFEEVGFCGNEDNYYSYKNSLLGFVVLEKKDIPLSLAIL